MTPDESITAFREHLLAGAFGDRELLMPVDQDYSGMWAALCREVVEMENRFGWDNPIVHHLRTRVYQIADNRPDAVQVFALATTRYGREDDRGA